MYRVRGQFIAYAFDQLNHTSYVSRNELRRGRRKRGPYDKTIESPLVIGRRDQMYRVRGQFIAYPSSTQYGGKEPLAQ